MAKDWKVCDSTPTRIEASLILSSLGDQVKLATRLKGQVPFGGHVCFDEIHAICCRRLGFGETVDVVDPCEKTNPALSLPFPIASKPYFRHG